MGEVIELRPSRLCRVGETIELREVEDCEDGIPRILLPIPEPFEGEKLAGWGLTIEEARELAVKLNELAEMEQT